MFSKKDNAVAAANSNAAAASAAKRGTRGTVPSIISADLSVSGTLISNGDIQIDGIVEGDIRSVGLVIGEKAEIHGEIFAEELTVRGRVTGRIHARRVQLAATSHVEGDILHEAFSVEAGAFFEGSCRHSDNPLGTENPKTAAPQARPSAQAVFDGISGLAGQPAE